MAIPFQFHGKCDVVTRVMIAEEGLFFNHVFSTSSTSNPTHHHLPVPKYGFINAHPLHNNPEDGNHIVCQTLDHSQHLMWLNPES
jgi:hypothetical protein